MREGKDHPFTKAEMKILLLVGDWRCAAIISELLNFKLSYVYTLQKRLNKKYGSSKIQDLVFLALEKKWILLDREAEDK